MTSFLQISGLLLLLLTGQALSALRVSVTSAPGNPNGVFMAQLDGGNTNDRTPNPCYRKNGCRLVFFTIDSSWLPLGRDGYGSYDKGWDSPYDDSYWPTLGQWFTWVRDKSRVGSDYLPSHVQSNPRPCIAIAAREPEYTMIAGTIVSNCAKGIVQAPSCKMTPETLNVHLSIAEGTDSPGVAVGGVSISCTTSTRVRIETNTEEEIPLSGMSNATAILDWGAGYGRSVSLNVQASGSKPIPLRVKTKGLAKLGAGVISGSAIVNISYE